MNFKNKLFQISIFITLSIFGIAGQVSNIPKGYINYFDNEFKLSEAQTEKFGELLKMYNSQAVLDRDMFKSNPIALVEAAIRRLDFCDMGMNSFLNDDQKEHFRFSKKHNISDRELYILKEGLILTKSQSLHIGFILNEFDSRMKIMFGDRKDRPEKTDSGERSMRGDSGGSGPGGGRGGGMGGGRGGMRGGGSKGGSHRDEFDALISSKSKSIKSLLTESQGKIYKKIKIYIEKLKPAKKR